MKIDDNIYNILLDLKGDTSKIISTQEAQAKEIESIKLKHETILKEHNSLRDSHNSIKSKVVLISAFIGGLFTMIGNWLYKKLTGEH